MRDAGRLAGVVLEILGDQIVVLAFQRSQVLQHGQHRLRIVTRARHQEQPVLVRLQFVSALHLRQRSGLQYVAEVIDERREKRRDAEQQIEQLRFRLHRDDVPALDVARFVADDAGQFVVGLHEIEQRLVDVDVAAQGGKGIDIALVSDDLDVVRHIFARRFRPQFLRHALHPADQQGVGFDHAPFHDLLIVLTPDRDFGLRGKRQRRRRNERGQQRDDDGQRNDASNHGDALNLYLGWGRRVTKAFAPRNAREGAAVTSAALWIRLNNLWGDCGKRKGAGMAVRTPWTPNGGAARERLGARSGVWRARFR